MQKIEQVLGYDSIEVLNQYPLLGSILGSLVKKIDRKETQTLGVAFHNDVWTLYVNDEYYLKHNAQQRMALLLHEAYHIMLLHCFRITRTDKSNIAADIIVNELISETQNKNGQVFPMRSLLPQGCYYETFSLKQEQNDTVERILRRLKLPDSPKSPPNGGSGGDPLDDHSKWGQGNSEKGEYEARAIVETACQTNDWGCLGGTAKRLLTDLLKPKVKWSTHLRVFGQGAIRSNKKWTVNRPSRRYGFPVPGVTKKTSAYILVGIDVSGSVSPDMQKQFLSECVGMSEYAQVDVATFDVSIVDFKRDWVKGEAMKATHGGTDPQCVFDLALTQDKKPDRVIILTDGYFGSVNIKGLKTLFVIPKGCQKRDEAQTIEMD